MTRFNDRYPDLLEGNDSKLEHLVGHLNLMEHGSPSIEADAAIRKALSARSAELSQASRTGQPSLPDTPVPSLRKAGRPRHARQWNLPLRARLSLPIAAACVLALSLGAFLNGQGPATASAASILRHAATAGLAPSQISYFDYQVTNSAGFGGATKIWMQADANGQPTGMTYGPQPQIDAGLHEIVCPTASGCYADIATRFLVGSYEDIVGQNSPASLAGSQVTGQEIFDDVLCDVVRAPSGATLYFDAKTYVLQGAQWTDLEQGGAQQGPNSTWNAELSQSSTVTASQAPQRGWWYIEPNGFSSGSPDQGSQSNHVVHHVFQGSAS